MAEIGSSKFRLKRNVYIILSGILVLALIVQVAQSPYVLQFYRHSNQIAKDWRPVAADPSLSVPSGKAYCLVYDGGDPMNVSIWKHANRVLGYMKKPSVSIDISKSEFDPSICEAVIVSSRYWGQLGDLDRISRYVENGGYVMFAVTPEIDDAFYRLYRKTGILNAGSYGDFNGINLTSNVLIGGEGLLIEDDFISNSSILAELDSSSRVLATSYSGTPLLWDFEYGTGKFMLFNGTMLQEKANRGLLAGAISLLVPDFIYPVFNAKLMYIDDFPAPIAKGVHPQIYRDYNRDIPSFFAEVWWPDMLKAASRYDIKYTSVFIESYNDLVDAPFADPPDADLKGLISFGREVLKSGGEIGLHGYNHQALQMDQTVAESFGYKPWKDAESMADSIRETIRFVSKALPSYRMNSYVPPSNVLSAEGREALKAAWPELAIISSLYEEDAKNLSYVQEFVVSDDGILEMPRVTSGYTDRTFDRWLETNVLTTHGYFSHFIHPDDLLDPVRSGHLNWEQLYESFVRKMARVEGDYSWLKPSTSTEAGIRVSDMLAARVDFAREGDAVSGRIEPFRESLSFVIRTDATFKSMSGCKAQKIDEGTYLLTASSSEFHYRLSR